LPLPRQAIKLGGRPFWVQEGDPEAQLFAQVASDFGIQIADTGCLYLFPSEGGGLEMIVQPY
jgi:hypothetical protein